MLILKDDEVKVIIEIEESGFNPVHLFGKFLASAMSKFYIDPDEEIHEMADSVLFIQILLAEGKNGSRKPEQWENIYKSICEIIPVKGSNLKKYELIYGRKKDFAEEREGRDRLISCIKNHLRG
jgi:hypothetical protein